MKFVKRDEFSHEIYVGEWICWTDHNHYVHRGQIIDILDHKIIKVRFRDQTYLLNSKRLEFQLITEAEYPFFDIPLIFLQKMTVTINSLVTGKPTPTQLAIFERADKRFPSGRYYIGSLTQEDVDYLDPPVIEHQKHSKNR